MLASAKALVLTHEMTDEKEWAPYAATVLQPLRPLTVYGRSAKKEPKVPSEHSIFIFGRTAPLLILFVPWHEGALALRSLLIRSK